MPFLCCPRGIRLGQDDCIYESIQEHVGAQIEVVDLWTEYGAQVQLGILGHALTPIIGAGETVDGHGLLLHLLYAFHAPPLERHE